MTGQQRGGPAGLPRPSGSALSLEERDEIARLSQWMRRLGIEDDGHFPRVMLLTLTLCEQLKMLDSAAARRIALRAGLLHDIGKALIAPTVLNKAGPLSPAERVVIEKHPELGARLVANLHSIEPEVTQAILHHHEAYGGDGYPYGLAGLQIPRLARVISVADVYDALTSTRPYRAAWNHREAMNHLKSHTGTLFDPVAVWALGAALVDATTDPSSA